MARPKFFALLITGLSLSVSALAQPGSEAFPDLPRHGAPVKNFSPALRFERLMLEHGISDLTINAITQDHEGYLWIATRDGLNRYDGYSFAVFRASPGDPNSLPANEVWDVFVDRRGILWIGTANGLSRYDRSTQSFFTYRQIPGDTSSLNDNQVFRIFEDSREVLWVGTQVGGLNRFDRKEGAFSHFQHDSSDESSLSDNSIETILEDSSGGLWISTTHGGINRYDRQTGRFTHFRHTSDNPASLANDQVWTLAPLSASLFLVGTFGGGLDLFTPSDGKFTHHTHREGDASSLPDDYVSKVLVDHRGTIWIGTQGGGIATYNPKSESFTSFVSDARDPFSLSDNYCAVIFEDLTRTMWFGTGSGLNKLQKNSVNFRNISNRPGQGDLLASNNVSAILETKNGDLWIGNRGGLTRVSQGESRRFTFDSGQSSSAAGNTVLSLCEDGENLWVGTGDGLYELEKRTGKFQSFRPSAARGSLSGKRCEAIVRLSDGSIWVGTRGGGVNRFNRDTRTFTSFRHRKGDPSSLSSDGILALIADGVVLWVGTQGGLNTIEPVTGAVHRIEYQTGTSRSTAADVVEDIRIGRDGRVWIATARGLFSCDRKTHQVEYYDRSSGLPDIFIRSLEFDMNGNLWVCTRAGFTRCSFGDSTSQMKFSTFGQENGLAIAEFNPRASGFGRNGDLYFGGTSGVVVVDPSALHHVPLTANVAVTSLRIRGEPKIIPADFNIELQHNENIVEVAFAVMDFTSPGRNRFAYTLDGVDQGWSDARESHSVRYTNLSPGRYIFRVKGFNAEGVSTGNSASLFFNVLPPWYTSWWFIALSVLAVCGVIAVPVHARIRRFAEIELIRSKISRDLHDDIGTALTRITILSDVASEQLRADESLPPQAGGATGYSGDRFSPSESIKEVGATARELHEQISDVVWSLDSRNDSLQQVIQRLKSFSTGLCEAKNIRLVFIAGSGIGECKANAEFVRTLLLVTKEAVSNAVRHARCNSLHVSFDRINNKLEITIADDGPGFNSALPSEGNGLKNMRKRVELLDGRFTLTSSAGSGTRVHAVVPIRE